MFKYLTTKLLLSNLNIFIMKNLKIIIIAFALFAMNVSAATIDPVKPTSQLRSEIIDLIGNDCPYDYHKDECKAEVLFTVNAKQEIVILSVTSPNSKAESYLKSRLNYKKVSHTSKREGEVFMLPIRMVREYRTKF